MSPNASSPLLPNIVKGTTPLNFNTVGQFCQFLNRIQMKLLSIYSFIHSIYSFMMVSFAHCYVDGFTHRVVCSNSTFSLIAV